MSEPLLDPPAFGERVRAARMLLGLEQSEVAKRAGIGKRALETYEAGERIPRKALPELAAALEVDAYWLLYGSPRDLPGLGELAAQVAELVEATREGHSLRAVEAGATRERLQALEQRVAVLETLAERKLAVLYELRDRLAPGQNRQVDGAVVEAKASSRGRAASRGRSG